MNKKWTEEEVELLKNNYPYKNLEKLILLFPGKTKEKIKSKAKKLKLLKDKEYITPQTKYVIFDKKSENDIYKKDEKFQNKVNNIRYYKIKYGIILDIDKYFNTYNIIQWYLWTKLECTPNGKNLTNIPNALITNDNIKIITKYVIEDLLKWNTRDEKTQLTQPIINKYKISFSKTDGIKNSPYNLLNLAYPELNLRPWEMVHTTCNFWKDYNNFLELVKYYYDNIIDNYESLELYFTDNYICEYFSKLYGPKQKYYTNKTWQQILEDIGVYYDFKYNVSYDGIILNSNEEVQLYNYIHNVLNIKTLKSIGFKRKGKYIFKYNNFKMCPDFVVEKIDKRVLDKPLIIEYYGLYNLKRKNKNTNYDEIINKYNLKTLSKNEYYKNNNEIYFIDLYPKDLKNGFEGVRNKLTSFLNSIS